jgi:protein-tyrosine phosphatase
LIAAGDANQLQKHEIGGVLTAAGRLDMAIPDGTDHKVLSKLQDHPEANLLEVLEESFDFLDAFFVSHPSSAVLVHCASGISRSVAVCIGWLMCRKGFSYTDALAQVRLGRPHAMPNAGFQNQLRSLEACKCDIAERCAVHWISWETAFFCKVMN